MGTLGAGRLGTKITQNRARSAQVAWHGRGDRAPWRARCGRPPRTCRLPGQLDGTSPSPTPVVCCTSAPRPQGGNSRERTIARLLGGYRERLPVYASTTSGQRTPSGLDSVERYADFAESCQAAGIPAFKIHSFFDGDPKTEIAIMSVVRQRVGQDMKLMTDPASSLKSFMDAVEVGRACDDLGHRSGPRRDLRRRSHQ